MIRKLSLKIGGGVICERNGYVLWGGCGCLQEKSFFEHYDNEILPDSRDICCMYLQQLRFPFFRSKLI